MTVDPIARFRRWFAQAQAAGVAKPEAMAVATADRAGRPSVRFVLLKRVDSRGFVFYTNASSRKGRELAANPHAALVLYWEPVGKQVRIEGRVEPLTPAEADAYWATRSREKQLAGAVSDQSALLASRAQLLARWRALRRGLRGKPVPRPPHWIGYRIVPQTIEFWTRREHRLHDRELFVRARQGWTGRRLQP